jgi:hypothetical protein
VGGDYIDWFWSMWEEVVLSTEASVLVVDAIQD